MSPPNDKAPRRPPRSQHKPLERFDESPTTVDGSIFDGIVPSDLGGVTAENPLPQGQIETVAAKPPIQPKRHDESRTRDAASRFTAKPSEKMAKPPLSDSPAESAPRSTQPFNRENRASPSRGVDTAELEGTIARLEITIRDSMGSFESARATVEAAQKSRQELLEDAKRVNDDYRKLVDKLSNERDALTKELSAQRSQYAADAKKQAQAFSDLQRDLERERQENGRKLQEALQKSAHAQKRTAELEEQLREALDSRDRIAERVRRVEENLEHTVLPLREELDTFKVREAKLQTELASARKEIAALQLLARPPAR